MSCDRYNPILRRNRHGAGHHPNPRMYGSRHRIDSILGQLRARIARMRSRRMRLYHPRNRACTLDGDVEKEKKRLSEEEKMIVDDLEKEAQELKEKNRIDEKTLAKLKEEILMVELINEHIVPNSDDHHTDLFECTERDEDPQLVVRRGQEFKMTITFQRPFDKDNDDIYLRFNIGEEENVHKKTCAEFKLREDDRVNYMEGVKRKWGARILEQSGNDLTIAVYSPPYCIVGEWDYSVITIKSETNERFCNEGDQDFVVLFNPWCKDDQTYMENETDLNEYVLNPFGTVFSGSYFKIQSKPWYYAQFQNDILKISLKLLRKAMSISLKMGSPVHVSRGLSSILNDCGDNGVLSGRWDGNYKSGVKPGFWQGSAAIMKQYENTNEPVEYGQCWVFSHLLTTVSRALGIPCRSVTNFSSAHDTDTTMTIDTYVDDEGDKVEKNGDSIWNFHVWNEVWMHRPDLDKAFNTTGKYDGWQAVDATPQEESDSMFQCGPSPVTAIKLGEVQVGYDTKFIFSEVNAECCTWRNGSPPILMRYDTNRVGKCISTKVPDGSGYKEYVGVDEGIRLDITNCYKAEEGSAAEREAVKMATDEGTFADKLFLDKTGVHLSVVEGPVPDVGKNFVIKVQVQNTSNELRSVRLRTSVRPATYWGTTIGNEKIASKLYSEEKVKPKEVKKYDLTVEASRYYELCDDSLFMRAFCMGYVRGFEDPVFASGDVQINVPKIAIQGPSHKVKAGEVFDVKFKVTNPLNKPMTNCQLCIDGSVFVENKDYELSYDAVYKKKFGDLSIGQTQYFTVQIKASPKPKKSKVRELNVAFSCEEMPNFEGNLSIKL